MQDMNKPTKQSTDIWMKNKIYFKVKDDLKLLLII